MQEGGYHGWQSPGVVRFCAKSIRAKLVGPLDAIRILGIGKHHHSQQHRSQGLDVPKHGKAVAARHVQIGDDERGIRKAGAVGINAGTIEVRDGTRQVREGCCASS